MKFGNNYVRNCRFIGEEIGGFDHLTDYEN